MILHVYTDGGLKPMPTMPKGTGLGGTGVVIVHPAKGVLLEASMHFNQQTTNQRMEMSAALAGLSHVASLEKDDLLAPDSEVHIHSDSAYLINCMKDEWWYNWIVKQNGGWKNSSRAPVENQDLWRKILGATPHMHGRLNKVFGPSPWNRLVNAEDKATLRQSFEVTRGVTFIKVKGHSNDKYNNRADALATMGKNGITNVEIFYDVIKTL